MKTPTLVELEDAVNQLEYEISDTSGESYFNISVTSNGYQRMVEFVGIILWDSDNDSELEPNESIDDRLRTRLNEELKKLKMIKIRGPKRKRLSNQG